VSQKGATPEGASDLMSLINSANLDVNSLGEIARLFGSGADMRAGTSSLVPDYLHKSGAHINASLASGIVFFGNHPDRDGRAIDPDGAEEVHQRQGPQCEVAGVAAASQAPKLQGALDSRIAGEVGFASLPRPSGRVVRHP
jgi:hypothetical protein